MLTLEHNMVRAAREILKMGKFSLIIKRGGYGAILFTQTNQVFAIPAYPLENVVDPTGAGDSFAGGFMGYLASRGSIDLETIQRAMIYGNIVASFSVEGFSVERLSTLTREVLRNRLSDFLMMTHLVPAAVHVE
jgi:sugar/nucleoside kinase (ribokinase family)